MILLVFYSFFTKYPLVDQSDNWNTRQLGEQMLDQMEPNALVFGYWEVVPVIEYLTKVEGLRPDLQAVNRFLISDDDLQAWIIRDLPNRPIYIDSKLAEPQIRIKYLEQGLLYQLADVAP